MDIKKIHKASLNSMITIWKQRIKPLLTWSNHNCISLDNLHFMNQLQKEIIKRTKRF
jgi:hypothetical protein